jgi:sphinganine-1-phosphate aldolase
VKNAINSNTILIVGSAPEFSHGIIDPIDELSEIALQYKIGLHVDCCLGGFVLPFACQSGKLIKTINTSSSNNNNSSSNTSNTSNSNDKVKEEEKKTIVREVNQFDFSLKGVTSISADTHKYGLAPKGSSVVMYRNKELRKYMYFTAPNWVGGVYASPTMSGSRPGSLIATTWASMIHLGYNGYTEIANRIIETTIQIKNQIKNQVPEIEVCGDPVAMVISFKSKNSKKLNIFKVMDHLSSLGWSLNALQYPDSVHLCLTANNATNEKANEFIKDLKESIHQVLNHPEKFKGGMAPIYGLAVSLPDRSMVSDMVSGVIDSMLDI